MGSALLWSGASFGLDTFTLDDLCKGNFNGGFRFGQRAHHTMDAVAGKPCVRTMYVVGNNRITATKVIEAPAHGLAGFDPSVETGTDLAGRPVQTVRWAYYPTAGYKGPDRFVVQLVLGMTGQMAEVEYVVTVR